MHRTAISIPYRIPGICATLEFSHVPMKFSSRSLVVLARQLARQSRSSETLRAPLSQVRPIHQNPFVHHKDGFVPLQLSFESVGVRQRIATACLAAFPNIKHPVRIILCD